MAPMTLVPVFTSIVWDFQSWETYLHRFVFVLLHQRDRLMARVDLIRNAVLDHRVHASVRRCVLDVRALALSRLRSEPYRKEGHKSVTLYCTWYNQSIFSYKTWCDKLIALRFFFILVSSCLVPYVIKISRSSLYTERFWIVPVVVVEPKSPPAGLFCPKRPPLVCWGAVEPNKPPELVEVVVPKPPNGLGWFWVVPNREELVDVPPPNGVEPNVEVPLPNKPPLVVVAVDPKPAEDVEEESWLSKVGINCV